MTARGLLDPAAAQRVSDALRRNDFTASSLAERADAFALVSGDPATRAQFAADSSPAGTLTRLFVLGDWLDGDRVARLLPEDAEPLLERRGSRVRAAYVLSPYGDESHDWWVLSDHTDGAGRPKGPEHVLGVGHASTTLAQITVRRPVRRALDVGTGSGVQALHLTTHTQSVVATDVVPRALDLAATTFDLSGVQVELAEGDMTEPVGQRLFDLVVCNPPFVLGPSTRFAYRDSALAGAATAEDGDAFCRRAVRACAEALDHGGVAQLLANWLHVRGEDWRDRVSSWVADLGCDAWLLERDAADPVDYVRTWAADAGEGDDTAHLAAWLDWFAERDAEAVGFGWVVLRRGPSPHRVAVEEMTQNVQQPLASELADWLDRTAWLRRRDDVDLLAHTFRVNPAARLDTASRPGLDGWYPIAQALTVDTGFHWSMPTDELTSALVAGCNGKNSLGSIVWILEMSAPDTDVRRAACQAVRALVDRGVLVP